MSTRASLCHWDAAAAWPRVGGGGWMDIQAAELSADSIRNFTEISNDGHFFGATELFRITEKVTGNLVY